MTTPEHNTSFPLVGPCLYTCSKKYQHFSVNQSAKLNNETCGPFKRTGMLCSKCIEGYGLPVYSYSLSCVNCTDYKYNWIKYIAVAYGPLTLFYIAAVVFRISATSGLMICYVTICQMLTIRGLVMWLTNVRNSIQLVKAIITILSIWNLDFFRSLYPPFCLHPTISALHVLLLDYLVAVYPLILILITYSLVKLHARYTLVVWFCKPLHICFHKFRKEWDIKTSLVASFATFYLLSYVKIINVTADVLTATYFYNINQEKTELYYYYNASIPYFCMEHLPYAVFAIIFSFLFNVCPLLLLCLYPCTCFHKCLNKTRCRCHTLHVFMDALLGSFSHKPRERRYFGAVYLLARIVHVTLFAMSTPYTYLPGACFIMLGVILLMTLTLPHKKKLHNRINLLLLFAVANASLCFIFTKEEAVNVFPNHFQKIVYYVLLYVSLALPFMYGLLVIAAHIMPKKCIAKKLHHMCKRVQCNKELEDSMPYRLEHSERDALLS